MDCDKISVTLLHSTLLNFDHSTSLIISEKSIDVDTLELGLSSRHRHNLGLSKSLVHDFICVPLCIDPLVTVIVEEDQINPPICSPGAFIRQYSQVAKMISR